MKRSQLVIALEILIFFFSLFRKGKLRKVWEDHQDMAVMQSMAEHTCGRVIVGFEDWGKERPMMVPMIYSVPGHDITGNDQMLAHIRRLEADLAAIQSAREGEK
jgi:hypothetical protein